MKRLLIILLLTLCCNVALAKQYSISEIPNVQLENRYRFTSNPDEILSASAVAHIDSICYNLREQNIAQIAVVAISEIESDDVFDFAYELFSDWGVGGKNDSGIGILLVEKMHEIRFVTGYATEGVLPDAICKRIQVNQMLPYFRRGDYSSGMVAGIEAISEVLRGSDLTIEGSSEVADDTLFFAMLFLLTLGGTVLFAFLVYYASRRCPRCKKTGLQQQSTQLVSQNLGFNTYEDTFVCKHCGCNIKRQRNVANGSSAGRRGGGGGPFIGGGFGGGFGGGSIGGGWGGGRFGGGGAGSRW